MLTRISLLSVLRDGDQVMSTFVPSGILMGVVVGISGLIVTMHDGKDKKVSMQIEPSGCC